MNESDYISIEAYLSGELSAGEKAAFDARLAAETALAAALTDRQLLHEHLRAEAAQGALRGSLNKLNEQFFPAEEQDAVVRKIRPGRRRWLSGVVAAAAIALLVFLGGQFLMPGNTNTSTYEQFAQHQPLSLTERGTVSDAIAAETAFNEGRFEEATGLLEAYLLQQTNDQRARLALGISLLENNRDAEAIKIFAEIAEGNTSMTPYGNWYLALAAVKRGETKAVLEYLDRIPEGDAFLAEKVAKLRATL